MIKVLVVDDHVLIRRGIRLILETYPDIKVVKEAGDGEEAVRMTMKYEPDVVLMDLSMPNGIDGFTAANEIIQQHPDTKILILTMYDEEVYIQKAVQLNAHGYILKNSQGGELYKAIQSVYNGQRYYQTGIPQEQIEKMFKQRKRKVSILTLREQEVVRLTVLGFSNLQIGEKLSISHKTVENHKANIMQKLGLKTKQELIQYGIQNHYHAVPK
jgi:two-component system response regulator NreC